MSTPAQTLEVVTVDVSPIARPTYNLIVADAAFLSTLKSVEATVATLKITDAQSLQQAADLQARLTGAGGALEKTRVQLKAPYLALNKQIDAAAQPVQARIDLAKRALDVAQTSFRAEQRRLADAAEAERKRQLAFLEVKRVAEEAAAKKKAEDIAEQVRKVQEAAKASGVPADAALETEVWDELPPEMPQKTETEKAIEVLKFAPAVVVAKAQGVREVTSLVPFVTDVNKLPDFFVEKTAKIAAIRSTFCAGHKKGDALPVLEGCRFEEQTSTVSTGRNTF